MYTCLCREREVDKSVSMQYNSTFYIESIWTSIMNQSPVVFGCVLKYFPVSIQWTSVKRMNGIPSITHRGWLQKFYHFADGIFKYIFLNQTAWISLMISLEIVPKVQMYGFPAWFSLPCRKLISCSTYLLFITIHKRMFGIFSLVYINVILIHCINIW